MLELRDFSYRPFGGTPKIRDSNLDPLQEHPMILTTKLSLPPLNYSFAQNFFLSKQNFLLLAFLFLYKYDTNFYTGHTDSYQELSILSLTRGK